MCAGNTYYFVIFKDVWVLPGNWAKKIGLQCLGGVQS